MEEEHGLHIGAEEEHGHHVGVVDSPRTEAELDDAATVGDRGRPCHLRRIFRMELRLGQRRHPRLHRHGSVYRRDVYDIHLQLHGANDLHSARRRPVRLRPPCVWPERGLFRGRRAL